MDRKIYRSKTNKIISGVCGGLGEYFNIDPAIIRLFWLVLAISTGGSGIITYIVCSLIIPEENDRVIYYDNDTTDNQATLKNSAIFIGVGLIIIGGFLLAKNIFPQLSVPWYKIRKYWPILLIIGGIYILYRQKSND